MHSIGVETHDSNSCFSFSIAFKYGLRYGLKGSIFAATSTGSCRHEGAFSASGIRSHQTSLPSSPRDT